MESKEQPDRPRRYIRIGRTPACATMCMLAAGCAGLTERIAEEATPIATEEAVETVAQPENAEAVARLLTDPAVKAAIREVSEEAARGMLALGDDALIDARELSDEMVRAVMPAVAGGIRRDLSPMFAGMIRQGTGAAFEEAFSPVNLGRVQAFGTAMTQETVRTLSEETANVLVPGVVSSLFASTDAAASKIDLVRLGNAVGQVSYAAAHDALLGANDSLRMLQQDPDRFFLASVESELERTLSGLRWLAIPFGLLLVVGTLSLAWLAYAVGRDRRALAQRDDAVGLVMHLLLAAEGRPWAGELRELLRDHVLDPHRDTAGARVPAGGLGPRENKT